MYQIKILPLAQRDLDQFNKKEFQVITKKIRLLTDHPRVHGSIKLTNEEGYRLRIADYRVLYRIDDAQQEIFIYRVKHRKEVYR